MAGNSTCTVSSRGGSCALYDIVYNDATSRQTEREVLGLFNYRSLELRTMIHTHHLYQIASSTRCLPSLSIHLSIVTPYDRHSRSRIRPRRYIPLPRLLQGHFLPPPPFLITTISSPIGTLEKFKRWRRNSTFLPFDE